MTRLLVVTGDDVALHPAITDGVLEAHDHGILTACSVVAGGPDLDRAVALLRERPGLEAGLHLVVAGAPLVSPPRDVPTLAPGGRPFPDHRSFLVAYARRRIDVGDVEREAFRQAERLLERGLRLTHVNGHQHLHVLPAVAAVVARLAAGLGIRYARVPAGRLREEVWRPARLGLHALGARARAAFAAHGLVTNDRAVGVTAPGHLTASRILGGLGPGIVEVVTHPGVGNAALEAALGWGYDWDGERAAIVSPVLRAALERRDVRLAPPSEVGAH